MLAVNKIDLRYGNRQVLSKASLAVPSGMLTGLVGPSGCGKSSLLTLLAGLERRQAEQHAPLTKLEQSERPRIGIVFQKLALWPHLTLAQNILLARDYHSDALSAKEILHYSERLGVSSILDQYPSQASLGEQQRVALLRALAIRPQFLLLDEPTSALDEASTVRVEQLLLDQRDAGVGVLVVSHDRSLIERIADQVFCVRDLALTLLRAPQGGSDAQSPRIASVQSRYNGSISGPLSAALPK